MYRSISFRNQMHAEIQRLLTDEQLACQSTIRSVVQLVDQLAHYQEEGVTLFPEIILCNNIRTVASMLHRSQVLFLGSGPRDNKTIDQALRHCASLARGTWIVYLERTKKVFNYGVIAPQNTPTAVSASDLFTSSGHGECPCVFFQSSARGSVRNRRQQR